MTETFRAAILDGLNIADEVAGLGRSATLPAVLWAAAGLSTHLRAVDLACCPPDAVLSRAALVYVCLVNGARRATPGPGLIAPITLPPLPAGGIATAPAAALDLRCEPGPPTGPDQTWRPADRLAFARYGFRTNRILYGPGHHATVDAAGVLLVVLQRKGRHLAELALRRTLIDLHDQRGDRHAAATARAEFALRLRDLGHDDVASLDGLTAADLRRAAGPPPPGHLGRHHTPTTSRTTTDASGAGHRRRRLT